MTSSAKTPRLLIGSEWRETGRTTAVINPYRERNSCRFRWETQKTADEALTVDMWGMKSRADTTQSGCAG